MKIICHNTQYWASSVLIFTLFAEWYFNKLSQISSDFHVSMVDTACFIKEKVGKSSVHMVLQILCFRVYQKVDLKIDELYYLHKAAGGDVPRSVNV